jgi:lipopolysaccharide export system protein LptC
MLDLMSQPSAAPSPARTAPREQDEILRRRREAFQDAARHSKRVHFLRRVLPIIGGIIVVLVTLWLWLDPLSYVRELPIGVGALKISGTKLTMEAPRLTGFSKDGNPYSVTAESASQDLTKTGTIELANIVGKFTSQDRGETVLKAKSGVYDSKEEKMRLYGDIHIDSKEGGYSGLLHDAVAEPKKGTMRSDNPVAITFNEGNLRSDNVQILDHGKSAIFEGNVVVNLKDSAVSLKDDDADAKSGKAKKK